MKSRLSIKLIAAYSVCLVLFGYGIAAAAPQQGDRQAVLVASSHMTVFPGRQARLVVRLHSVQGRPLAGALIVLLDDKTLEMYARTDARGIGLFRLPPNLSQGEHRLWIVFPGNDELQATAASTLLNVYGEELARNTLHPLGVPREKVAAFHRAIPDIQPQTPVAPLRLTPSSGRPKPANESRAIRIETAIPSANKQPRAVSQSPLTALGQVVLTVTPEIHVHPGPAAMVDARLATAGGQPIVGANLVLFAGDSPGLRARTATNGSTVFHLPPTLLEGDYALSIVFPGSDQLAAAMANATLHYYKAAPAASADQSAPSLRSPAVRAYVDQFTHRTTVLDSVSTAFRSAPTLIQRAVATWTAAGTSWVAHTIPWLRSSDLSVALLLGAFVVLGLALSPALATGRRMAQSYATSAGTLAWLKRVELPMPVWYGVRILSVGIALGLVIVLAVRPDEGLFIFWRLFIPLVPLVFFLAPGLWRNVCPMAVVNQAPRLFNFTQALTLPKWMERYGYLVAISLFLLLVSSRKVIFNQNGLALAGLILCVLAAAFIMGNFFKGKSGWCSSICPLLPVQRIYGQTPFVAFSHAHCEPCIGCTKNCYDLSPSNAYLADLYDEDRLFAVMRKAFVGFFPGFVLAFYLVPNPPIIPIWQMYAMLALAGAVSMGTFFLFEATTKLTSNQITVVYGAAALNFYYWFNSLALGSLIASPPPLWFVWSLRALVFGLTLIWIYRTYQKEPAFIELTLAPPTEHGEIQESPAFLHKNNKPVAGQDGENQPAAAPLIEVIVEPEGERILVASNRTLLETIEKQGLPIESGCRMGLCGADPVCILAGMENLSKIGSDERKTLERLGLTPTTRLACMARVRGPVKLALTPEKPEVYQSSIVAGFRHDISVKRVVIVGNGIAGATAADHIRRRHPQCEIHLIGREPHHLYNRMGITRLIYGRSAMQGLYLLPDQWYDDFNITCWLNTQVTQIDTQQRQIVLGTGETLAYDRLILTTGSRSFVPQIAGFGVAGTFVLRTAEDAMSIRAYVQEQGCRNAIVTGGGLLGLEAAYGLSKMGLTVTVVERGKALLLRQLDARSAEFLAAYLEGLGMQLMMETEVAAVNEEGHEGAGIQQVTLTDGQILPCDLLLVSAGIRSDVELARDGGLAINQGVVVDTEMRTSDPNIFAAGDVAEFDHKVYGLWPVAVNQAEVAAANAVAEPGLVGATYLETPSATMLKVAGIDVTSIGRITPQEDDDVIVLEESAAHQYRKLIMDGGKIVGAILLGYPQEAAGIIEAVKQQSDMTPHLAALKGGDWQALRALA